MDPITRFCAFALFAGACAMCILIICAFAYLVFIIAEAWDRHIKKESTEIIKNRRNEFKLECERAGKDLMLHDELERLKHKADRFRPIRKAVGYFSDEVAQALVQ